LAKFLLVSSSSLSQHTTYYIRHTFFKRPPILHANHPILRGSHPILLSNHPIQRGNHPRLKPVGSWRLALSAVEEFAVDGKQEGSRDRSAVFDPEPPFGLSSRPKADRRELSAEAAPVAEPRKEKRSTDYADFTDFLVLKPKAQSLMANAS